jgi:hypothetical protein
MWLLVRATFWLGAVILLLPSAPTRQPEPAGIARSGNSQLASNSPRTFSKRMHEGGTALGTSSSARAKQTRSQDTLTPADLAVRWRGQRGARLESPIFRTASSATCIDISAMRRVL